LVLAAALTVDGPFFPASSAPAALRADSRRCSLTVPAAESDCALIAPQWVVSTAGAVAAARPTGGRLHVRVGDDEFAVEQLVYHPKWHGGTRNDVTLLRLATPVPAFPMASPPGEVAANVERVARRALEHRAWVVQTIGPSTLWDERACTMRTPRRPALFARVRSLVDGWTGRTSND
jgi:hypothetical protein